MNKSRCRSFGVDLGIVCLAALCGSVLAQARDLARANTTAGSCEDSCVICEPDTCQLEPGQFLILYGAGENVLRCVEYDHVPPHHCATMGRQQFQIGEWVEWPPYPGFVVVGYCFHTDCAGGTPTSTECTNAWELPDPEN